ncbi:MAG TPA: hypothetical protein VNO55_00170 [Polyangia bacterium]|nr:hypothetical protein [Polyangia bacterium]
MAIGAFGCASSDPAINGSPTADGSGADRATGNDGPAGSPDAAAMDLPGDGADCCAEATPPGGDDALPGGEVGGPNDGGSSSSACKTVGLELCEDFESGAIDPKIWGMHTTAGSSLIVDKEHAHTGSYALHVKLAAGQPNTAQITDAVTFPAKDNTFYTRAFVYFNPDLPADNMGGFHMAYLLATGNNDLGFVEAGLGSSGNKQYLGYSEYYGAGPGVHAHGPTFYEFGPGSPTKVVPMKWICLELLQGGNATTTTRRVWVDDKELPEQLSNYTGRKPPQFDLISIGVLQYHPTPILTDVWIDDIRVSSTKIGCATP